MQPSLLSMFLVAMTIGLTYPVRAQTFTTLHTFFSSPTNGYNPNGSLLLVSNTLFGTTTRGGSGSLGGWGAVYAVQTDGSGFRLLHSFDLFGAGVEGATPQAGLIADGQTLYGTTANGGRAGRGTIFKINMNGTGFTNIHHFENSDSNGGPHSELVLSGDTLYGTTTGGGTFSTGSVFALDIDGSNFTNLHSFSYNDGSQPNGIILSDNVLYGTTYSGGTGYGTVFALNTDGTAFTNLHIFLFSASQPDGTYPLGNLVRSGKTLYGTTSWGFSSLGTVFAVNVDGTGYTNLHTFASGYQGGAHPPSGLVLRGNTLYGTAGVVFALDTDGTDFSILHTFTDKGDGREPLAPLILSGNTLYGTASTGEPLNVSGTVFSVLLPVQLSIAAYDRDIVLTWPTHRWGFHLQATTNLLSPVWTSVSPGPAVANDQNIVVDSPAGTMKFYRLSQ